ncbi:MAG: tRNA 2-thiouridine(34) synthase MnmA [Thermoleophilia bacterium]
MSEPEDSPRSYQPYSPRVLAHLRSPVNPGTLEDPDATGTAGSHSCGDLVGFHLRVEAGRVVEVRFQAFGCPATIAAASEISLRLRGATLLEAARLGGEEVADHLGLPAHKRGCSAVAADALHDALEDWVRSGTDLVDPESTVPGGVLVAMSGGVDSAVTAPELRDSGARVVGVTFRLWSDPACGVGSGCCSPETVMRARRTAHDLGLPHLTVDLAEAFHESVVKLFVAEYSRGRTPNPCVACNSELRFSALVELAERLGLERAATGHYARLVGDPPRLARAMDPRKDQSYVLARVAPDLLGRMIFPLGSLTKIETRARAREAGLEVHDAEESQEICFIPDDDYRRFLGERLGDRPGPIIDRTGAILGDHRGAYRFTVGQRKGLGVQSQDPLYVTNVRPSDGAIVVGSRHDLAVSEVVLGSVVRHGPVGEPLTAQLRSSGLVVPVRVSDRDGAVTLTLLDHVYGVALGQTGVVYADELVVLAGSIEATVPTAGGSSAPML